jgi:methylthioribose-1-phosphate isomerase
LGTGAGFDAHKDQGKVAAMKIDGKRYRTIWAKDDMASVYVIDQTRLPFALEVIELNTVADAERAIRTMIVRGAPLIGATAAYGMALAARADSSDAALLENAKFLRASRPTAINLAWAVEDMSKHLHALPQAQREAAAFARAAAICDADVAQCEAIGNHGSEVIRRIAADKKRVVNILTHCNAGWLACVDWGTALAPIYKAHNAGIPVHVWVDETRPRNQGAFLTAYELGAHGVPHTVIADNLGGHLMREGRVDMAIVGSDRTCINGDVCNKIGTYLKALAAHDNNVPFYVALPSTTIDWSMKSGDEIPIEERDAREMTHMTGITAEGRLETVRVVPEKSPALNLGFDVTPARYVTGLILERGICDASREGLLKLFPERRQEAAE